VAGGGIVATANTFVRGQRLNVDAIAGVPQCARSGRVYTDVVPQDSVVRSERAQDAYRRAGKANTVAGIGRDDVSVGGSCSTDRIVRIGDQDAIAAVAFVHCTRRVGADEIAYDHVVGR